MFVDDKLFEFFVVVKMCEVVCEVFGYDFCEICVNGLKEKFDDIVYA